jgi:HlyD family secretion protein
VFSGGTFSLKTRHGRSTEMQAILDAQLGQDAWPVPSLRRIAIATGLTVAIGFGGLGTWASLTPLDSAVSSQGLFVAAGKRKTVSLQDGGILKELLVKEGDRVTAGQTLLLLDDVQLRTAMNQATALYWGAIARIARLGAETRDERRLALPEDLLTEAKKNPIVTPLVQAERDLFASRWDTFDGNARISGRKIEQLMSQRAALLVQLVAFQTRLALSREELIGVDSLLKDGYETKTHELDLRRSIAELQGGIADAEGRIADAGHVIEQTKLELTNFAETRRSDSSKDLQETQGALADAEQRLKAAQDLLDKREIPSPEAGIVTDIKSFTPGSSITAGQPVLDIVPADDRLLIEAPILPTEIEHVHVGQRVNVKLSAYKTHRVPTIEGRLVYVAADRVLDSQSNPVFYVRAELDRDALKPFPGVTVYPGMPADLLIIGSERTAMDFITSPILDGMRHGMREE